MATELTLEPGRELDALVAEKPYSTDIAAAWSVVEALPRLFSRINPTTDGFLIGFHFEQGLNRDLTADYYVRFEFESCSYDAGAPSLPHAICLAALKAVATGRSAG